jgi:CheY-like chemotaxis protein
MDDPTEILLVEDNPNDVELILAALSENQIADEVFVARDGEEALDYLHRRGAHESRSVKNPKGVLLDLNCPRWMG